jgi:hypothetical protein
MANPTDFHAHGKVIAVRDGTIIFNPSNTNYEIQLMTSGGAFTGTLNAPVRAILRVEARKVWTVPSGGNFIAPIFGPPKTIQGRVRFANDTQLVVSAAASAPFLVNLPADDAGIDMSNGPIALNTMVNVVALPGATFELITEPIADVVK